jgi:hypothetical protein
VNRTTSLLTTAAVLLATLTTAAWLFRGAPELARAPGWFYQTVNKGSLDMLLVAAAAAALPFLIRASFRQAKNNPWRSTLCIVLGSVAIQIATGLIERHGIRGWTERFFVGHGEFTAVSRFIPDAIDHLRNYEKLAAANQLGLYGPSKPPGTYAVYLAIDRSSHTDLIRAFVSPLADLVALDPDIQRTDLYLVAWTILLLGLFAAFTTVPLFFLARSLFAGYSDSARSYTYPAWLFATAPATNVITVHLDSTLFPFLSATSTALCAWSARVVTRPDGPAADGGGLDQASAALAMGAGLFATFAVYCSYGNLPILAVGALLMPALTFQVRTEHHVRSRRWETYLSPLAGIATGTFAMLLLLCAVLDWHPVAGYLRGVGYHQHWRPNLPSAWKHGLAFLEFSLFAGPPLMLAFLASSAVTTCRTARAISHYAHDRTLEPKPFGIATLTLATALLMLIITLAMGTPEAARLWLFMLPWVCCAASALFTRSTSEGAFNALLTGQIILTFFVKNYLVW